MTKEIQWQRTTSCLGRNGSFKCQGLLLQDTSEVSDTIRLVPLTSRGLAGRCSITIPLEAIEDVISSLDALHRDMIKDVAKRSRPPFHENCPGCVNCGRGQSDR